jgi:ABC-type Na+ efflux pump permease subunit
VIDLDLGKVLAITSKDMKEVFSSVSIYGPMIGVPSFFALILPILTYYVAIYAGPTLAEKLASIAVTSTSAVSMSGLLFINFFSVNVLGPIFMTMPILTASVIAADSFAGEKERKTSEALLATPVSSSELLLGKVLASFIPTTLLTVFVFAIYGTVINTIVYGTFQVYILPTLPWIMMLMASPFLAIATIGLVVLISAHVRGTKEAQQISTILVLPILIIPFISVLGIADLSVTFFTALIAVLFVIDLVIMYISAKTFRKEGIL